MYLCNYISWRFFENQSNDICSQLSEMASKGMFLKPEKLEGKGKEKKKEKERGEGKEEKRKKQ